MTPNSATGDFLSINVGKTAPQPMILKLFKNNKVPAVGDVAGDYVEADFIGYTAVAMTAANWTVTEGAPSEAVYPRQTFVPTQGGQNQDIYGFYIVRAVTGRIVHAERFSNGPYNIASTLDDVKVDVKFRL